MLMNKIPAVHVSFTTIVLFNSVVFLVFVGNLYALILNSQGDWQGLGLVAYAYMLLGFLAFTSYFYYDFLNHMSSEHPRYFTKLVFILNILAPIMLLVYLLSASPAL
jgi:hypothetical protein